MPFVAAGESVTGLQVPPGPRSVALASTSPLVQTGQLRVNVDAACEKPTLEAVICSSGIVCEEICTESIGR